MDQTNKVNSSKYQGWFFGERSLLPMGDLPPFVGKLSVGLGRLKWKW
jgi:hypothetical protein